LAALAARFDDSRILVVAGVADATVGSTGCDAACAAAARAGSLAVLRRAGAADASRSAGLVQFDGDLSAAGAGRANHHGMPTIVQGMGQSDE